MRKHNHMIWGKSLAVFLVLVTAAGNARAELYESAIARPAISSPEYEDDYIEDDTGQIKELVRTGFLSGRSYNVYLPNGEKETMPYKRPAILLLHGAGRTGASLVERWRRVADREDVILLGPHAKGGGWNAVADARDFIPALLKDAVKKYNVNPNKIYVFGHSMGGIFASTLAITQPEGFAAIGIHAGMLPDKAFGMMSEEGRKTPIVFINGTKDPGFPLSRVRASAKAFDRNGHEVNLYVLEDHGHWYYDIADDINDMAWDFFAGKALD